jgi:hypothetical protein
MKRLQIGQRGCLLGFIEISLIEWRLATCPDDVPGS